jgi:hypothetical protein
MVLCIALLGWYLASFPKLCCDKQVELVNVNHIKISSEAELYIPFIIFYQKKAVLFWNGFGILKSMFSFELSFSYGVNFLHCNFS